MPQIYLICFVLRLWKNAVLSQCFYNFNKFWNEHDIVQKISKKVQTYFIIINYVFPLCKLPLALTYLFSLFFFERSSPFFFSNFFSEMSNTRRLRSMLIWIIDFDFIMLSLHNLIFFISLDNCSLGFCKIISALLISSLVFATSFSIWDKFSPCCLFSSISAFLWAFSFSILYLWNESFTDKRSFGVIFTLVGPPTLSKSSLTNLSATIVSSLIEFPCTERRCLLIENPLSGTTLAWLRDRRIVENVNKDE